jgi:hypothetical protein
MGKFRSRKIPGFGPVRRARRHLISPQLAKPLPERARPLSVPHSQVGEFSLSAELPNYYRGPLARSACPIPKLASSRLGRAHRRSEVPGNLPRSGHPGGPPRSVPRGTDLKKRFKIRFFNLVPVLVRGRRPLDGHLKALLADPLPREKDPSLCPHQAHVLSALGAKVLPDHSLGLLLAHFERGGPRRRARQGVEKSPRPHLRTRSEAQI